MKWTTRVENDFESRRYYQEECDDMMDALEALSFELDETIDALENGQLTVEEGAAKLEKTQYLSMLAEQNMEEMLEPYVLRQKFLQSPQPSDIIAKLRINRKVVCFDDLEDD